MVPRPANPKVAESLLRAAQELVIRQGFSKTSIEQVCRRAGVAKGSFFHYFASKQELGEELLRSYSARQMRFLALDPEQVLGDPRQRVRVYLRRLIAASEDPNVVCGCLLGVVGQETAPSNARLREVVAGGIAAWSDAITEALRAAKRSYAPRARWSPREVGNLLVAVFQGGLLLGRVKGDATAMRRCVEHYAAYVESLLASQPQPREVRAKRKEKS